MKKFTKGFFVVAVFGGLFAAGFCWRDLQQGRFPSARTVTTFMGIDSGGNALSIGQQFQQTFNKISGEYVRATDSKKIKYSAISGMMASLGDPHTTFLEPTIAKEFDIETSARFFGIGARLMPDPLGVKIANVFTNGPADRAGMKASDTVTAINGQVMAGKTPDEIADKIRGPKGTVVNMQLLRPGVPNPINIRVVRDQIITPTVESKILPDKDYGYLSVSQFSAPTAKQFVTEVQKLEQMGIKGLVIDLRGNPGGLLNTASDMLALFAADKVVVSMKERTRTTYERTASGQVRKWNYPIVCLMNEDSASASEIFAGCLRDYGIAQLVGDHSYGKASVQNVLPLRDTASVKITIARYFLPTTPDIGRKVDEDGQYISGGLAPDFPVKIDPNSDFVFGDLVKDPQLKKAVEVLKSKQ
ncbi:MAG: S41 family peptidase [Fimbriimonadaceae bacterium]